MNATLIVSIQAKIQVFLPYFREEKTEALAETKEELEQTNLTVIKLKEEVNVY